MSAANKFLLLDERPDPDFENGLMLAELALCLLRDRQYKLGREALARAIGEMEPQNLADILRSVYAKAHADMAAMHSPFFTALTGSQSSKSIRWGRA